MDQLRAYTRPAFIYLPPGAELRGGAWVVIDAQINAERVEMYADPSARGGVLEPEGIVEIKFRVPELLQAMHRIDPAVASLKVGKHCGMRGFKEASSKREECAPWVGRYLAVAKLHHVREPAGMCACLPVHVRVCFRLEASFQLPDCHNSKVLA